MKIEATNPEGYIQQLSEERQEAFTKLRQTILDNLPEGFAEEMDSGMIAYNVPHTLYPKGYHCDPKKPLPFISIASQKNFIVLYHMGIYANTELLEWFQTEYPHHSKRKLDMGKSCIRFKKIEEIPYTLLAELLSKMTVKDWTELYENQLLPKDK